MAYEENEQHRQELIRIAKLPDTDQTGKICELSKLSAKVGAGGSGLFGKNNASISALHSKIHHALQTASMIEMCESASKGYEIALEATRSASKTYWIAAGISILSMLAAWVAVIVGIITN